MISAWGNYGSGTAWEETDRQVAQEETFGEPFAYEPRRSRPNKLTIADPSRQFVSSLPLVYMRPHNTDRMRLREATHQARNSRAELRLANLPYEPQQGDQIVQRSTGYRMEVCSVNPNGYGVAVLELIDIGIQPHRA